MAALTAMGAGANPIYLGSELPVDELLRAAAETEAAVLALSVVTLSSGAASRIASEIRLGLPRETLVWFGGSASVSVEVDGVESIHSLEGLERRVTLLCMERAPGRTA